MSRLSEFIRHRTGWEAHLAPFMEKPLPGGLSWGATLGSVCALLFAVMAASGMLLAMYYNPAPDLAYASIDYIMREVSLGPLLRGIHHWGAGAMVILVFAHLLVGFFEGSFKRPRELTWIAGVFLLLLTLGFGFTGYLLPWDQKAYWATMVGTNIPRDIPLVGEFVTRVLLAGDRISGLTLTRFYAIHMLVLPALTGAFIAVHIYLVRLHGIAEPPRPEPAEKSDTTPPQPAAEASDAPAAAYRFYPEHLARAAVAFVAVFGAILLLSIFGRIPAEEVAGTADPAYLPRPEWYFMWLFQLLTFFPGESEIIGSLLIPLVGVGLLFLLPFLSKTDLRRAADRPLATAAGVACLAGILYLTLMGLAGARPYGHVVAVPDRALTPSETAGLKLFVERDCAYCHHIAGRGGRREGPDLSNVPAKGRSREWLVRFVRDPQAVSRWSIMPKYDFSEADLNALADFALGLDFDRHEVKTVSREDALKGRLP
jgi:ubiquinol-cytochrome c reductase cytochrome b subunit